MEGRVKGVKGKRTSGRDVRNEGSTEIFDLGEDEGGFEGVVDLLKIVGIVVVTHVKVVVLRVEGVGMRKGGRSVAITR